MGDDSEMEQSLELDWWLEVELCSLYQNDQTSSSSAWTWSQDFCQNIIQDDGFLLELSELAGSEEKPSDAERNQRCLKLMSSGTVVEVPMVEGEQKKLEVSVCSLSVPAVCNA